jgi:hypothetical protein
VPISLELLPILLVLVLVLLSSSTGYLCFYRNIPCFAVLAVFGALDLDAFVNFWLCFSYPCLFIPCFDIFAVFNALAAFTMPFFAAYAFGASGASALEGEAFLITLKDFVIVS